MWQFILCLFIFILSLVSVILVIPIYIRISYQNKRIKIYLYNWLVYELKIDRNTINKLDLNKRKIKKTEEVTKDNKEYLSLLKTIKIKRIYFECSYQVENWYTNSYLLVLFYSILGIVDSYCYSKKIKFDYLVKHESIGIPSGEIKVRVQLITTLFKFSKIFYHERIKKKNKEKIKINLNIKEV